MVEIEKPCINVCGEPRRRFHGKHGGFWSAGYGTHVGTPCAASLASSPRPVRRSRPSRSQACAASSPTIPGARRTTEIVLNVKSIIAKLHSEGVKTVYIEASGECEVTAGDIKADGEVEVLN